jgi:hypothetical protein
MSSPTVARVTQPNNKVYNVDLMAGTYSCRRYQQNNLPCGHAIALVFRQGLNLEPWLQDTFSIARLKAQYTTPLPPIDISTLAPLTTDRCEPPMTRVPRGRPKKERIRKDDRRARRGLTTVDLAPLEYQ